MASNTSTANGLEEAPGSDRPSLAKNGFLKRFDIGTKLFVAFCAVAALTILAAVVAWALFGEVRQNMALIAEESLPEIENSFQLAQENAQLSAAIPLLANANSRNELREAYRIVAERLDEIEILTFVHGMHQGDDSVQLQSFDKLVRSVNDNIEQLRMAVSEKIAAKSERDALNAALAQDHRAFIVLIDPLIDAAREEMLDSTRRSVAEGTAGISSLIDDSFDALRAALVVQSNVYYLTSAMYQAFGAEDADNLFELRNATVAPIAQIKGAFSQLSDSAEDRQLAKSALDIVALATGQEGVFDLKGDLLAAGNDPGAPGQAALAEQLARLQDLQTVFTMASNQTITLVDEEILRSATEMSKEGQTMVAKTQDGVEKLETLILVKSAVNQLFGLLGQGSTGIDAPGVALLEERYGELRDQIDAHLHADSMRDKAPRLRPSIARILDYGRGSGSIFAVRLSELAAQDSAASFLVDGQRLAGELNRATEFFVDLAKQSASHASAVTLRGLGQGEIVLLGISALSLAAVVLIAWIVVLRNIVRRLQGMSSTMLAIADGNLEAPIPPSKSNDEISDMAQALVVFKQNALKRRQAEESMREAKEKAEAALSELQAAQRRLVQSEKMASLGQLTAGIAHEIKNPLNFVNNFASLSQELLDELKEQLDTSGKAIGSEAREEIDDICADLDLNLGKINEHGKRADGIVRGMLEHSRESSNTFDTIDINKLLEEYVNLAYHGMRAQNKKFNVTLDKDLAADLGPVEVVPQDLGRVILNITANAFQAVFQKSEKAEEGYDPRVTFATKRRNNQVEIRIRDNGPGMPEEVVEKVFQPFFTTKAAGEGTGLGLSISYDIVVEQHGGRLDVQSSPGEGTEFQIVLPVSQKKTGG